MMFKVTVTINYSMFLEILQVFLYKKHYLFMKAMV
jgi:hypothetical protein